MYSCYCVSLIKHDVNDIIVSFNINIIDTIKLGLDFIKRKKWQRPRAFRYLGLYPHAIVVRLASRRSNRS